VDAPAPSVPLAEQVVRTLARVYTRGQTTTSGGNVSCRDASGTVWITPAGRDKGRLRADEVVAVGPQGAVKGGLRPSSELPFHRAIYGARPELAAVVHAHPPALVAFSATGRCPRTDLVRGQAARCGRVAFVPYEPPASEALGTAIAAAFAAGADTAVLENHGVVTAATDLATAYRRLDALDTAARAQIAATALGPVRPCSSPPPGEDRHPAPRPPAVTDTVAPPAQGAALVELAHRAVAQRLMEAGAGVVSQRLPGSRLLIVPATADRGALAPTDLAIAHLDAADGDATTRVHRAIYAAHPDVDAVFSACPPHLMAFAATGQPVRPTIIPEAYLLVRQLPTVAAERWGEPDALAARLSAACPAVLVDQVGVVTVGTTPLQAFDRLEVAEFTARAVVEATRLGGARRIGADRIAALDEAFQLPSP